MVHGRFGCVTNIRFDDGWGKKAMKTLTYFLPLKRVAEFFPF